MTKKKTTRGITISVTLPQQLEKELQDGATEIGISRSRFIANILIDWQATKENKAIPNLLMNSKGPIKPKVKNDCTIKDAHNYCAKFNLICMAGQVSANTCAGYASPIDKGEK